MVSVEALDMVMGVVIGEPGGKRNECGGRGSGKRAELFFGDGIYIAFRNHKAFRLSFLEETENWMLIKL